MTKTCIMCGKALEKPCRKFCSDECRTEKRRLDARICKEKKEAARKIEKRVKKKPSLTLNEVARLARAEGLSYGEYSAKYLY